MNALFIINPSSGRQNMMPLIERIIGRLIMDKTVNDVDVYYTKQKNDAFQKSKTLQPGDYDFIVGVGGDGTINEIIGGLYESQSQIPLAVLPAGTVNDFATYMKLPRQLEPFVQMIQAFHITDVDIGKISDQYFANVVAMGAFSDISFRVPKSRKAKLGALAYYLEIPQCIPELFTKRLNLKLTTKETTFEEESVLFLISNTGSMGGVKQLATKANVSDGLFDVIIIRKCELTDLIALSKDILLNQHLNSPFLNYFQTDYLKVESDNEYLQIDIDGELGPSLPIEIKNIKQGLHLICP